MIFVKPNTLEIRQYSGDTPEGFEIFDGQLNYIYDGEDRVLAMNALATAPYLENWTAEQELDYWRGKHVAKIKTASQAIRNKYLTNATGKDAEYTFKAQEATDYLNTATIGTFMQARIALTGETALTIANEWNNNSLALERPA